MRAGRLDKKIDIIKSTEAQSTLSGEMTRTWSTYIKNRWAQVEPLSGRELFQSNQWRANVDYRFTIRYSSGISPQMRIVYSGSSYQIHSVIDINDEHKEIQMLCSRVTT